MKNTYKIEWYSKTPDKDGNRLHQSVTISTDNLMNTLENLYMFYEITEDDIEVITKIHK